MKRLIILALFISIFVPYSSTWFIKDIGCQSAFLQGTAPSIVTVDVFDVGNVLIYRQNFSGNYFQNGASINLSQANTPSFTIHVYSVLGSKVVWYVNTTYQCGVVV